MHDDPGSDSPSPPVLAPPAHPSSPADTDSGLRQFGPLSGTLLVVANMIGVGVFTSAGFQVDSIGSLPAILIAWLVGGLAALCGALCYAELGAAFPHNGGEYQLLSRIYHPLLGFLAAWTSLLAGFSASAAAMAQAFGVYLQLLAPPVPALLSASLLILFSSVIHAAHVGFGLRYQNAFTAGKVLLIAGFIALGLTRADLSRVFAEPLPTTVVAVGTPGFAIALIYIAFSYAGWNSAAYLAGEMRQPGRNLPIALVLGTLIVAVLYLGLNLVFLGSTTPAELAASGPEVANVAATALFGPRAASVIRALIALGLISTVSALILTGPRVYEAVGRDFPRLRWLSLRRAGGGPVFAILLQGLLSLGLLYVARVQALLEYIGVSLSIFSALTICGVFVLRIRAPHLHRPYRVWAYPLTPLLVLALDGWMLANALLSRPLSVLAGLATVISGTMIYLLVRPASHFSDSIATSYRE